jgi:CheY-like chemotaxis protein
VWVALAGGRAAPPGGGPGRGATFTVRLPARPEPAALAGRPRHDHRTPRPRRVLVVEDNRDAADSLRGLLELFGHKVRVAYSGPDGVRAAEEDHPDVVVCDIGLPGLDGYEVAGALKRNPETAAARVIGVTGRDEDDGDGRTRAAGFDVCLHKPVDPDALLQLVAESAA